MVNELPNGDFLAEITLEGGSGKAKIQSPAPLHIENGKIIATLTWSSSSYDYMEIDGVGYTPEIIDGKSVFTVEIPALDTPLEIKAETVAMSSPHMIDYTLTVSGSEVKSAASGTDPSESSSAVSETSSQISEAPETSSANSSENNSVSDSENSSEEGSESGESAAGTSEGLSASSEISIDSESTITSVSVPADELNGASPVGFIAGGAGVAAVVAVIITMIVRKVKK